MNMGSALGTALEDGETFTTLRGEGRIVRRGRTVAVTECEITDSDGTLVARASSTCLTLTGKAAEGRIPGGTSTAP